MPKILELGEACPREQCVPCLFLKYPSARFLVIYLHSNAEDIGKCYTFLSTLREQFQVHVLAVEYPGYGICAGGPATADTVTENAFAVFRFVREVIMWPLDSIKIFGRSIGTGPAIALGVQYNVSGLILITPFLSVRELVKDNIGVLAYLVEERFPSKDRIHLVRSPLLIVHGQKDTLIPTRHGTRLYELARSRKLLVCPEAMEHNTSLLTNATFLVLPMLQFFALPDYCFEDMEVPRWAFAERHSAKQGVRTRDVPPALDGTLPVSKDSHAWKDSDACRELARITKSREPEAVSETQEEVSCSSTTAHTIVNSTSTQSIHL